MHIPISSTALLIATLGATCWHVLAHPTGLSSCVASPGHGSQGSGTGSLSIAVLDFGDPVSTIAPSTTYTVRI